MMTCFPGNGPQRLRLRRALMAYGFYVLAYVILLFAVEQQLVRLDLYVGFVVATTLAYMALFVFIRSGFNQKLRDPSVTVPQMHFAWATIVVMMYFSDEVRWAFLMMFQVVFLFGTFSLQTRELFKIGLCAMLGYATMIGLLVCFKPQVNVRYEFFQWLVLVGVLPFTLAMVGYINRLRQKLKESLQIIQQMATHDELTGVENRRSLQLVLSREKGYSDRGRQPFCLCMLDIDHFKKINDTYGHPAGDQVLRDFASKVACGLRATDYVARYGGEEFMVVLPQTGLQGAVQYAERLRREITDLRFPDLDDDLRITVSIGITAYAPHEELTETIDRVDRAVYAAKHNGRNRVETAALLTPFRTAAAGPASSIHAGTAA